MAFWQSPEWMDRVESIYKLNPSLGDPQFLPWWQEAWTLFRRKHGYDIIHTMGIRESFAYAFLCWITGSASRQIMTEVFIDTPKHTNPIWWAKTKFYRILARQCLGVITNSSEEITTNARRFNLPIDHFRYVPLCTTIAQPEFLSRPAGGLFCAGRTLRDYQTLRKIIDATELPWIVVGGQGDLDDRALPDRVTIYREIQREAYLQLLRDARVVILPLLPTERATGQVVLLEAMSYGKPVITTRAPGTIDLVRHGKNGFLTEPGDAPGIQKILGDLLREPEACERIGRQAVQDVLTNHSVAEHTRKRLDAIEELYQGFMESG